MTYTTSTDKFDRTARALHWISAAVILWAMLSGFYMALFEVDNIIKKTLSTFNVSLTFVYFPLFLWRLVHRITCTPPTQLEQLNQHQAKLACAAHKFIYLLTTIVMCSGVLMMQHSFCVFGLFTVPPLLSTTSLQDVFSRVHVLSNILLLFMITLHILAVIKHQLGGRAILQRML
ncbi:MULTISPECIES: cytochrome b/b6 domain-containing protein [unclassified Pseudoalteromonas]|uniref:cytochrome b n=1 Tax=unclassified Pseudoalteromonas TaxID=194690 RepID=UPI0020986339|nr:cytochrome b/b6 domain-containing protein [Pseudoalteromonas sp. XMcav2-N]MCO7189133.1 cytochrome b/b6 domain-containing protein [Pseudoalteromonas sp. XMcav2-N]